MKFACKSDFDGSLLSFPRMIQAMHPLQVSNFNLQILLRNIQGPVTEKLRDVGNMNIVM